MPRNVIDLTQPSSPPSSDHESIDLSELEDAIMAAEPEDLQLTLIAICSSFPQAAKIAAARLMIESDDQSDDQSEGESSKESESSAVVSNGRERKRVRPRYVRSQNCEEDFDAANATTEVCRWHEGSLEVNDDAETWVDWDERCHGRIESIENEIQYPEGFKYACCDGDGNAEGCQSGPHVE